ncbi:L-histidine N(alpha)-methyltransferase [Carboxylicivirga marina]|uniref:L-histidine N(Alpha)-methyltransferase n=1 Tax=Carboxylicivirga marina TaxID=2800988 RepID=A0ABS1HP06_9BACT|nr:L-histidine N(alpha)-methyltransferase [Carboxylicivirga marina]MBK3519262.1 L-histidine N(alpha)-methyltransferase [Carboxylicivirga marina]
MPENLVEAKVSETNKSVLSKLHVRSKENKHIVNELRKELIKGLSAPSKYISSKFFYDKFGSQLFEWITKLPEYYPTQSEKSIIENHGNELFGQLSHVHLIELGSGDCTKISLVLKSIQSNHISTVNYCPIDFSISSIEKSKAILKHSFPQLKVNGVVTDFTKLQTLPNERPRIICFFGSTIGNFEPAEAEALLKNIQSIMNPGDQLIMGIDLVKDISILEKAYNDSQRITEAFNKNILRHCNTLLNTNIYPPHFKHHAFFNSDKSRIEMHLLAKEDIIIESPYLNQAIEIEKGESIHTENSHKYSFEAISELAYKCNLTIKRLFYDDRKWFSLIQLTK